MTDRFEPAATDEVWGWWKRDPAEVRYQLGVGMDHVSYSLKGGLPALIALANAALPDSDPRKITRERVAALRALFEMGCCCGVITLADNVRWDAAQTLVPSFLDALASYLPPE